MISENELYQDFRLVPKAGLDIVSIKPLFSPIHSALVTASGPGIKMFNTNTGQCLRTLDGHGSHDFIVSLQAHRGDSFLSCSQNGVVVHWSDLVPKKKVQLPVSFPICHFHVRRDTTSTKWFVAGKPTNTKWLGTVKLWSCEVTEEGEPRQLEQVMEEVSPRDQGVSITKDGSYLATVFGNNLIVKHNTKSKKHLIDDLKFFTCVLWHPTEKGTLATGDSLGMIIIWRNVFKNNPHRTPLHWHHSPVGDLIFSLEGSAIYSGGKECVLVKWDVATETKNLLPRIGMPITRLLLCEKLDLVGCCMEDNSIQLVQDWRLKLLVTELVACTPRVPLEDNQPLPVLNTGLQLDPSPDHLVVLNARYGHLQFYSTVDHHTLFLLDVVRDNYEPEIDNKVVVRKQVGKVALDATGNWMATTESWYDGSIFTLTLKLWKMEQKQFTLHSHVEKPHTDFVVALRFLPEEKLVSVAADGEIRLWGFHNDKIVCLWRQEAPCLLIRHCWDADVSLDGGVLAQAFNSSVVLWDLDRLRHLENLPHSLTVRQVKFGKEWRGGMLVTSTGSQLLCWDLGTLEMVWVVDLGVVHLESHLFCDVMAAVTSSEVFVFQLADGKLNKVCDVNGQQAPIVAAIFVPKEDHTKVAFSHSWKDHSKLYLFDAAQVLYEVADEKEISFEEQTNIAKSYLEAPLSWLSAEIKISDKKAPTENQSLPHTSKGDSNGTNGKEKCWQRLNDLCKIHTPQKPKEEDQDDVDMASDGEGSESSEEETMATPPKEEVQRKRKAEDSEDGESSNKPKQIKVDDLDDEEVEDGDDQDLENTIKEISSLLF